MTNTSGPGLLDGAALRDALAAAAAHLRESAKAVDAINVYPVPDGDTGSNMAATLREAVDATQVVEAPVRPDAVLQALAKGALYGARGNSGVILSQALRGLANGVGPCEAFDAAALARGLQSAQEAAYRAVSKPVEGTMLTVLRAAAAGAGDACSRSHAGGAGLPCAFVLGEAIRSAEEAEVHTPEQLAALAEAGVTDAGGEGICVILRGLFAAITGQVAVPPRMPERPISAMAGHEHEEFGFCTEFILEATTARLDAESVRAVASQHGNRSVVVVGDENAIRVHVHSDEPQRLLEAAATLGRVTRTKLEDMSAQHARWVETGSGANATVAVLALSRGKGLDAIFESLGASVTDLGHVVKPPAGDIAAAADALHRPEVIVLPNHKNVVMAARQAATLTHCTLHVLPTETLPQGISAMLAFDPGEGAAGNLAAMERGRRSVRTVEITIAAATRSAEGVLAVEGQAIALVDDTLVASAPSVQEAVIAGLEHADAASAGLITLYGGEALTEGQLVATGEAVRVAFPGVEVEVLLGGQPLYPVIASVES
jgi:DAK2 domain fusion protein YloV